MNCARPIDAPDCLLGENPVWYEPTGEYLWTDILRGTIYAYASETGCVRTVLETPYQTGAFLAAENGTLVVFTERGVFAAALSGGVFHLLQKPLWTVPFAEGERFNDAIADPCGQMLSGSKRADNTQGKLYRFSAGKAPEVLLERLAISNGMGFSPDGRTFYHTDSIPSTITAYDYAPSRPLANPRVVVRLDASVDPDGLTVDAEGNLWFACWGAGRIERVTPQGIQLGTLQLDAPQCSSLCFGGTDLNDLFVTSASVGSEPNKPPLGGRCFLQKNAGAGKPEYYAKTNPVGV
ncbi:MAG: SMP-30/gluconolactonase/LRE family protein [Clostridiaceae bacterium]